MLTWDITVELDANGNASIVASDIDAGSSDSSGQPITLSIDQNTFNCDDVVRSKLLNTRYNWMVRMTSLTWAILMTLLIMQVKLPGVG